MAEEVVSSLIQTLASLIKDEVSLLKNFSKELVNIKDEFKSIQALLKDADKKGEMAEGEQVIKVWLKDLRHVAFDIEDLLEEYVFRHHTQQQPHFHGYGTCGFVYKIKYFFNKLIQRHNMASRIEDIKVRLQKISKRKNEYKLVDLNQVSTTAAASFVRDPRVDALFLDEAKVVGINEPREKLVRWLVEEPDSSIGVVSVFGPGGLGKTTLVKKVQENVKVKAHFPICGWITISQTVDIKRLLRELILLTIKEKEEEEEMLLKLESMDATQLKVMLHNRFQGQRYVIFMDDIWDLGAWKDIRSVFPDAKNGSRVIVTTRFQNIAKVCIENSGYAYELKPLTPENSWILFSKVAFRSIINDFATQNLREVSQKFLNKCGGLPLAIVAVAGFLSAKETNEWDEIFSENESLLRHSELNDVNIILSLSYNDLPYHLKSCLLYLCIFPDDHVINCSKLARLWAAEGFIDPKTRFDTSVTKEDVAKRYLDELIVRSLVQVQDIDGGSKVRTCRIHDLLRDFVLTKARDQDFAEFFTEWPHHLQLDNTDRVRRLSFSIKDVKENTLPNNASFFLQIRSLFEFGGRSLFNSTTISTFLCCRIKLLKVMDLGSSYLEKIPDEMFTNMLFLRYLSVHSGIHKFPSAVGKLKNLETLEFGERGLVELPVEILDLKCLRNLLGYGLVLPNGIGRLNALEKLGVVDGSSGGNDIFQELGMLTRLRTLSISYMSTEVVAQVFASLEKMVCLRSLYLKLSEQSKFPEMQNLRCRAPLLQNLTLDGFMNGRPDWILSMKKLTKLNLNDSRIDHYSFFEGLQQLPDLMELELKSQAIRLEWLRFNGGSFPKLRTLKMESLVHLKIVRIAEGAMPCIQYLIVRDCEFLDSVPIGIEHLTTLKRIDVEYMPDEFRDQMRSHCWKDGHFPTINIKRYWTKSMKIEKEIQASQSLPS